MTIEGSTRVRIDPRRIKVGIRIKKWLKRPWRCKMTLHRTTGGERGWDLRGNRVEYFCDRCLALTHTSRLDDSPHGAEFIRIKDAMEGK